MKVEVSTVQKIRLSELDALDPITVTLDDQGQGKGGITIACYGKSWTSWWGGMGARRIAEFFCSCSGDYLAEKLAGALDAEVTDYGAISEAFGYSVDATTLMTDMNLERVYGPDWVHALPKRENPDYVYLRRIIKATQEGLRTLSLVDHPLEK